MAAQLFDLDPARFVELRALLEQALALPEAERDAWLGRLDAARADLRPRLAQLLAQARGHTLDALLETLPRVETDQFAPRPPPAMPARVGPYRPLRLLGSGGMAHVWLAERTDLLQGRQVALKLPREGWSDAGFAARLAREREILATLEHPRIARLYDAGVDEQGRPWLALEHVEGERIDEHCRRRALPVAGRLRLVLQVLDAVAHAHARLVVHRDLKPSNILVGADGQVRLLDFGIAHLLAADAPAAGDATLAHGAAFTPDYASPEQMAGRPIGTASDLYSLGVLLFELLTGQRLPAWPPGSRAQRAEALAAREPPRASRCAADRALQRALAGDLDTIVAKALKPDPGERYASAAAFAEDLQRHLDRRPVLARPDGAGYRLRRFVSRHRVAVASGTLALAATVGGSALALWQAAQARAAQHRAEQAKELMASIFREADPYGTGVAKPGATMPAHDLLLQARRRVEDAALAPPVRLELLTLVGEALLNLDDLDGAESLATALVPQAQRLLAADDPLVLRARSLLASVHRYRGRFDAMAGELQAVRALLPAPPARAAEHVALLENEAHAAIERGQYAQAREAAERALALGQPLWPAGDARAVALALLSALAQEYDGTDAQQALAAAESALARCSERHLDNPRHPQMLDARSIHGRALSRAGQIRRSVEVLEAVAEDTVLTFGADSNTAAYRLGNLARRQRALGKLDAARVNVDRALAIFERKAGRASKVWLTHLTVRGMVERDAGRPAAALADFDVALAGLGRLGDDAAEATAVARTQRAAALAALGRLAEAESEARAALASFESRPADRLGGARSARQVLASVLRRRGELDAAQALQRQVIAAIGPAAAEAADAASAQVEWGWLQLARGDRAGARSAFEAAAALHERLQLLPSAQREEVAAGLVAAGGR